MAPPPPLRQKVPTLLPDVEQVVLTALAKDPHQRFATVQAFATALEQASQTERPVHGLTPSHPKPSQSELPLPSTVLAPHVVQVVTQPEMNTPVEEVQLPKPNPSRPPQVQVKPQPPEQNSSGSSQVQVKSQPAKPNQSPSSWVVAAIVAAAMTASLGIAVVIAVVIAAVAV
jgi:hypothetical protein